MAMRKHLANAGTVVLVACAMVVTGLVVQREVVVRGVARDAVEGVVVSGWSTMSRGPQFQNHRADVTIALFADYTCRYCRQFEGTLDSILPTFGGKVAVVHQHFPILLDGPAFAAALAAECAGEQDRFAAYHDLLYRSQDSLDAVHRDSAWEALASHVGVPDLGRFHSCMEEARPAALVRSTRKTGVDIGVTSTPTMVINGRAFRGAVPADVLMERITSALQRSASGR